MTKKDSTQVRIQMLKISLTDNNNEQTKQLLHNWSIRQLYDILGHAELASIINMNDESLTAKQIELVLEVLDDKANVHHDTIYKLCTEILALPEDQSQEINWRVSLINKMYKELPRICLKEIELQDVIWKDFFKNKWPTTRKKYLGR